MNKNWPRWIVASLCKHFDAQCVGLPLIIEGRDVLDMTGNRLQLLIDGPSGRPQSGNSWALSTQVMVLATTVIDDDLYSIHSSVGIAAGAFHRAIPVYKYGRTEDDDDSLLSCLTLIGDVQISHYGQPDPAAKILQSSVKANYSIHLEKE